MAGPKTNIKIFMETKKEEGRKGRREEREEGKKEGQEAGREGGRLERTDIPHT